jgi:diguanylate cyclase (GGDEF)-like protein
MIITKPPALPLSEETDADRRRGILADDALTLDLVSALAGDRILTEADTIHLDEIRKIRSNRFFCDILYSITHQYFCPETAEDLWNDIRQHKFHLSATLNRNVRIVVAALDYLSNITDNMDSATLVGEADIGRIVGLSLRDGLTGLFNHSYFYQQIDFEVKRFVRYGAIVSLILIDIDDFKMVNDTHGHREGDRILNMMGQTLQRIERDSDICCRYGGEEFAVILPLTDIHEAASIAERLRVELAEHLPDGQTVTVSIGVASCGTMTRTYRELVERADQALYLVKRSGKNRVQVVFDGEA